MSEKSNQQSYYIPFIHCLVGFILLLLPTLHTAQTAFELPKMVGKFSVAHLLDPIQPALHVALEHRLQERWYLHHQAGYLFKNYTTLNINSQQGFRLRSGIRHYTQSALTRNEKTFVEFNLSYMQSLIGIEDDFCRFDCAYFQKLTYERKQNIYTIAIDYGAANYFSKRFLLEIAVSGGLRLGNIRYSNIPPDAALAENNFNFLSYNPDATLVPIHFGVRLKLGYVLR